MASVVVGGSWKGTKLKPMMVMLLGYSGAGLLSPRTPGERGPSFSPFRGVVVFRSHDKTMGLADVGVEAAVFGACKAC